MKKVTRIAVALGLALLLIGCEKGPSAGLIGSDSPAKLVCGKVDTEVILKADPEYQNLSKEYLDEQIAMEARIQKELVQIGNDTAAQGELRNKALAEQKKLQERWLKKTDDFLQTRHGKMREAVAQLCKEKNIDLVVIDTRLYPSVEYGAIDITQDVLMRLGQATGTPAPGGTPQ